MAKVFVEKEGNSRLRLANNTARTVAKDDFVILGGISGVALEETRAGFVGAFHVEEGLVLQIGQADFATGASFAWNAPVFYLPDGTFSNTGAAGAFLVGQVTEQLASGVVRFAKYFRAYPVT